ncbi:hypothetical protein BJ875DRAFT_381859, partial [Amylocarpus encephaloides]
NRREMSLNGLDELKLKEAHDIAAAEPGGWFLLKYISRDEVDLLGKGNGGIVEIRNAVSSYEEPSPLFGFLRYRRRNVLIKYVPEGCSRLVQARVTVHFNAVTERFSPHDTVFPITTAKELRDTTLSSACSLHTASGSISSSTSSLRRRRLMEIAEDEEEDNRKRQSTVLEERPGTAKTNTTIPTPASIPVDPSTISLPTTTSHKSIAASLETSPPPLREPTIERPSPSTPGNDEPQPRKSSQSTRPDTHGYSSYGSVGRPKVKLGPRPSLDVTGGRPHTSGAASHYRPVSTLPVGLKILSKASRPRPQSQFNAEPPNMMISPPPMPDTLSQSYQITPTRPHTSGGRPPPCPTFPMKPLISPTSSTTLKTTLITPEKARLMKALELRKKHMKAPVSTDTLSPSPNEKLDEGSVEMKPASETSIQVQDTLAMLDDMAKASDTAASFDTNSAMRTDESDATRSDSYPVSPVGASEQAESTRASSISESTDGTLQESHTPKAAPLTANASVAVIEDAPKSAEMDVVKEGEDSMKFPEGASSNKEQSIPESVVAQASAPVEIQLPSIRKEERMAEQAKPQYSPERIPIPGVSSKSENDDSAGQDLNTISDDLKPAATIPSISTEPPSVSENTALLSLPQRSPPLVKRGKRKGFVEPIKTDFEFTDRSDPNSDAHLSSDDDFMDELQSAVVQEAKPVSVSKSPINAMFPPAKKPESWRNRFTRAASNPAKKGEANADLLTPPPKMEPVARSVSASAAYLKRINQENSKPLTKKVNVGSGISQRIKAFEKFSNGDPAATPPPSTGPLPGTTSAFFSVRKAAPVRVASKSPSIADRANSLNRNQPSPSPSRESSPEARKARERSGSIKNRVSTFEPGVIPMIQPSRSKPESISVTARIVRDPDQPFQPNSEIGKDPSEYVPLDLKQSPLVIDHQRAINNATPPKETIQERRLSKERRLSNSSDATNGTTKNRRSSITIVKDLINERRASFADRRRSINLEASGSSSNVRASSRPPSVKSPSRPPSVRSPSRPSATHPSPTHTRSQSISSRLSSSSNRDMPSASPTDYLSSSEDKAEKKSNRASRMLRRMSSSLSSGRKALAHAVSPTVREESEPVLGNQPPYLASPHSPAPSTPSVNIGDVNVQFPDSLLWKRRSMLLDSQGFLILSPALTASGNGKSKAAGGATRRFHLSEFRQPVIPDMEIEELPNSVLLDFFEGGGLQIACEDRAGQGRVLEGNN